MEDNKITNLLVLGPSSKWQPCAQKWTCLDRAEQLQPKCPTFTQGIILLARMLNGIRFK